MLVAMSAANGWDRNTQSNTAGGVVGVLPSGTVQELDTGRHPWTAPPARVGFQGLRRFTEQIVNVFMPGIPAGPAKVIASRAPAKDAGQPARTVARVATIQQPITPVEQAAPWWEYMS